MSSERKEMVFLKHWTRFDTEIESTSSSFVSRSFLRTHFPKINSPNVKFPKYPSLSRLSPSTPRFRDHWTIRWRLPGSMVNRFDDETSANSEIRRYCKIVRSERSGKEKKGCCRINPRGTGSQTLEPAVSPAEKDEKKRGAAITFQAGP